MRVAVKNSRTGAAAEVRIDYGRCSGCGLCATVCGTTLVMADGWVRTDEALELGSCMIGTVVPFIRQSKRLAAKYGMQPNGRDGIAVVFGYPAVEYRRAVRRTFAHVDFA